MTSGRAVTHQWPMMRELLAQTNPLRRREQVSLDNCIYVVSRSQGEYSDRHETPIVAFVQQASAVKFVEDASAQAREAVAQFPIDYTTYDDEPALEGRRAIQTLDPEGVDAYDYPYYFFCEVPLFTSLASGTEAGTAETTQIGSVHEGPTVEDGAPTLHRQVRMMSNELKPIQLPQNAGWCAWDADECWVMVAVDTSEEMSTILDQLPPRKRIRLINDGDAQ